MKPAPTKLALACAALVCGCGSSGTYSTSPDSATLVAVDPLDFEGASGCGDSGGFESYLATLLDVTPEMTADQEPLAEFSVQSSPVTSCDRPIAFGDVYPGRWYEVLVEGYRDRDGDPDHIDACSIDGTAAVGTADQNGCQGPPLAADYRWRCYAWQDETTGSEGDGHPVVALEYRTMMLHLCRPLDLP